MKSMMDVLFSTVVVKFYTFFFRQHYHGEFVLYDVCKLLDPGHGKEEVNGLQGVETPNVDSVFA